MNTKGKQLLLCDCGNDAVEICKNYYYCLSCKTLYELELNGTEILSKRRIE